MRAILLVLVAAATTPAEATVSCTVNPAPLAFGRFTPIDNAVHDSDTTIAVDCVSDVGSEQATVTVALDGGTGGQVSRRQMRFSGSGLRYNIFTDPARSTVWGDGGSGITPGAMLPLSVAGQPQRQEFTAYGRVEAGQSTAPPGDYTDSLLVTVTY